MNYVALTLIVIALIGCGHFERNEPKSPIIDVEALRAKSSEIHFKKVLFELEDNFWPSVNDCDATLWAGISCAVNFPQEMQLAEYAPGEIHRRPRPSCYNETDGDVGSKTTVSRDMLTGYLMCQIKREDIPSMKRLADYGEANNWIMGKPSWHVSRVIMGGNLTGLLGRALHKYSNGEVDRPYRHTPPVYGPVLEDYERHIQVQGILLQGVVSGSITDEMLLRLRENAAAYPDDFFFQAALGRYTGDQSRTLDMLMAFDPENPVCSSYVRGEKPGLYCRLLWLQAANILMFDDFRKGKNL